MDEFTREMFEVGYTECKRRHPRRSVSELDLKRAVDRVWAFWRNAIIEGWTDRILAEVPHEMLAWGLDWLWGEVERCGIYGWEPPFEKEEIPGCVAHCLAVLRWIYRESAGRVQMLTYDDDDVKMFLDRMDPSRVVKQMSMFQEV